MSSIQIIPFELPKKTTDSETIVFRGADSNDLVIVACVYVAACDGQTDAL